MLLAGSTDPVTGQEPSLTLGTALGSVDEAFQTIDAVLVTLDGRIVVADGASGTFSAFGPDGTLEARFGGIGDGPAEFGYLGAAALEGSEIVGLDRPGGKLVRFRMDGEQVSTRSTNFSVSRHGFPLQLQRTEHGLLLEAASGCGFPRQDDTDMLWRLLYLPDGASEWTELHSSPVGDGFAVYGQPPRSFCTTIRFPFGASPRFAVEADGRNVLYGTGEKSELTRLPVSSMASSGVFDGTGERRATEGLVAVPTGEERVTLGDVALWKRAVLEERVRGEGPKWMIDFLREVLEERKFPERWPAYDRIVSSDTGDIWLRRPPGGRERATWMVVNPAGELRGTTDLPADETLVGVRRGAAYATRLGEWDEPLVTRTPVLLTPSK